MKKRILLLLMIAFPVILSAQGVTQTVVGAFKSGEASSLESYLSDKTTFVFLSSSQQNTPQKVVQMLDNFFNLNAPVGCEIVHNNIQDDSGFIILRYSTKKGAYRVHLLIKKKILQIRIENYGE